MDYIAVREVAGKCGGHPLSYLSSCGGAHYRCCKKGKHLDCYHGRGKAYGFVQWKEEALKFALFCRIKRRRVRI